MVEKVVVELIRSCLKQQERDEDRKKSVRGKGGGALAKLILGKDRGGRTTCVVLQCDKDNDYRKPPSSNQVIHLRPCPSFSASSRSKGRVQPLQPLHKVEHLIPLHPIQRRRSRLFGRPELRFAKERTG